MPEHLHLSRRGLVRALLLAGGMKSGLLNAVRSADAMSRTPIVPGVQEFTDDFCLNGLPARRGDLVKPGYIATTGPNGSAIIIIGQHAFMLRANSKIEFCPGYLLDGLCRAGATSGARLYGDDHRCGLLELHHERLSGIGTATATGAR